VFHEENEDVVEEFLKGHPEFHLDPIDRVLLQDLHPFVTGGYFKTFPPKGEMDGSFVARLTKAG
jgi:16S rRNA (cytosine967-C5)-methyltransferase